jgi:tRNA 2-thiouridine synthesizing protein A
MGSMQFDAELDARGLLCPLPILKTRFAIDELETGQVLRVLATDEGSVRDMEAFARQTRNDLLESSKDDGVFVFYLRRG